MNAVSAPRRHDPIQDLKYYWRNYDTPLVPRDLSYGEKGFAEALELARAGDERAQLHLRRIVKRDPTTPQAQSAQAALAEA